MGVVVDLAERRAQRQRQPEAVAATVTVPGELAQYYRDKYPDHTLTEILEAALLHCRTLVRCMEKN